MATVIRFARHGRKKAPYFRIVVADSRSPRDGRYIEHIGAYNPVKEGQDSLKIDRPRLEYWLSTGAQMSDSVKSRLSLKLREWAGATIVPRKEKPKPAPAPEPKKEEAPAAEAAAPAEDQPASEAPAAEAAPAAEDKPAE